MNKQKLAILITAGIGALSTLMPWAKLPIVGTVSGTQTELGWITFGLFAVSILMCLLKNKSNSLHGWILYGTIFPSLLASIFGIAKIIGFNAKMDEAKDKVKGTVIEKMSTLIEASFSIEFGLYLVVLCGLIVPILAFILKDKNENNKSGVLEALISNKAFLIYFLIFLLFPLGVLYFEYTTAFRIPIYLNTGILIIIGSILPLKLSEYKQYNRIKILFKVNAFFWITVLIWRLLISKFSFIYEYNIQLTFIDFIEYYQYFFSILGLVALFIDFFEKEGKLIKSYNAISYLFKPKILSTLIILSFITLCTYNYFTKHIITYDELVSFRSNNDKFSGEWYFLNSDTTDVDQMNISFNAERYGTSGEVKLDYTILYNQNFNLNIKNSTPKLSLIVDYNFKISFPILFDSTIVIESVDGEILKGKLFLSDNKSKDFVAYRNSDKLYSLIRQREEINTNNVIDDQYNQNTNTINSFIVKAEKTHFHSEPDPSFKRKGYLVNGDVGTFTEVKNGYAFVAFTNSMGIVTKGWVLLSDLQLKD